MLARQGGMGYSPGIQFETILVNMEESKELIMNNQPGKNNKFSAGVAPSSTHKLLQRIALWDLQLERPKNWPWGWRYLNPKQRRQQKIRSRGRDQMSSGRGR